MYVINTLDIYDINLDIDIKIGRDQAMCETILRALKCNTKNDTQLKLYNGMTLPILVLRQKRGH